jgi:acetyl-CoA carboxylase biotin carboxyl carrier protein
LSRCADHVGVDESALPNTDGLLQEVCRSVLTLLAAAPTGPRRISVQAGPVVAELEWPAAAVDGDGQPVRVSVPPSAARDDASGAPVVAAPHPVTRENDDFFCVRAPTVGTFYRAPEPGARPFVTEGDVVRPGHQIGILEAMKMMLPVEASRAGRVVEFLVENGTAVEFDTPLMALTEV